MVDKMVDTVDKVDRQRRQWRQNISRILCVNILFTGGDAHYAHEDGRVELLGTQKDPRCGPVHGNVP